MIGPPRVSVVDDAQAHIAKVDAGQAIPVDGAFTYALPCLYFEPCVEPEGTSVARSPGGIHFCPVQPPTWVAGGSVYPSGVLRDAMTMVSPLSDDLTP